MLYGVVILEVGVSQCRKVHMCFMLALLCLHLGTIPLLGDLLVALSCPVLYCQ
jgi:hypothetical protein